MIYGQRTDKSIINEYLDGHICGGIRQKDLDEILDIIDDYIELVEVITGKDMTYEETN